MVWGRYLLESSGKIQTREDTNHTLSKKSKNESGHRRHADRLRSLIRLLGIYSAPGGNLGSKIGTGREARSANKIRNDREFNN